jgi:hypothetical protein
MNIRVMKVAVVAALLLGAWATVLDAQAAGKSVAAPGPAPSANYVWVTINGAPTNQNSVAIRHTDNTAVLNAAGAPVYLTGAAFAFNQPYDILASPLHHEVFVSNAGNGTVTVIDSDTLLALKVVVLPGAGTARGMSLSADETAVFVAGGNAAGPAVWQVDTVTLGAGAAPVGAIGDATHFAVDCVVIRAANSGGSGNQPGKVYFSVQTSGTAAPAPGYIGIVNLLTPGPPSSIPTQLGTLASVNLPTNMERTPDHRFVFVGCSKFQGIAPDLRIIRIDPLTDTASAPIVTAVTTDSNLNQVFDVSWRATPTGANRGFILANDAQFGLLIREIDETGAFQGGTGQPANQGGLTTPQTIRFTGLSQQVFVGDVPGTGNGYAFYDATATPLKSPTGVTGVGSGCLNFAVVSTPGLVVTDICPRAAPVAASMPVTVHGAGFTPGVTCDIGGVPVASTIFLDSNNLMVDMAGAAGTVGLRVTLPNFQTATIDTLLRRYTPPPVLTPVTITLPGVSAGYQMHSFPQYATLPTLQAALTAQLGPYNPALYRVFFYRNGNYVEINSLAPDGCDLAGESFWVLTRNGATLTLSDPDVRANDGGSDRVIPMGPGFNMISLPTLNGLGPTGSISWASVLVSPNPANFVPGPTGAVGVTTPAAAGILTPVALEFVNGVYVTADPLVAGRGYWVENISGAPAYLVFQQTAVFKQVSASSGAGGPPPAGMTPPAPPSGMAAGASSGCGLLGLDWLLPVLVTRFAFLRRRSRRRLAA